MKLSLHILSNLTHLPQIGVGKDYTLYALKPGTVKFTRDYEKHQTLVSVTPQPGPPPRSFLLKDVSSYVL